VVVKVFTYPTSPRWSMPHSGAWERGRFTSASIVGIFRIESGSHNIDLLDKGGNYAEI